METIDKLFIENLEIFANHGVLDEENTLGQKFLISVEIESNLKRAASSDNIEESIHYGHVCHFIKKTVKGTQYNLIEALADDLCRRILLQYPRISSITITVKKPWAPILLPLEHVSVKLKRKWHTVYLGLGSNLGDKEGYLDEAIKALVDSEYIQITNESPYYITKPIGYTEQDDFLNSVIEIKTLLEPDELLSVTQNIERMLKREREIKWGPRTIDIDILLYDDKKIYKKNLIIPHPLMHERLFVLEPLTEIAPYFIHPIIGRSMIHIKNEIEVTENNNVIPYHKKNEREV